MRMKSRLRRLMGLERRPATQTPESLLSAVQSLPGVQAGCTLSISREGAWLDLPSGVSLRYESGFNSVTGTVLQLGSFEEHELQLVVGRLQAGAVMMDVGANVGLFSIFAALTVPGVVVHAFEPVPATFASLEANLKRNRVAEQVVTHQVAVSESNGMVHITTDFHSSNYLVAQDSTQSTVRVPMITIDSCAASSGLTRLDFIKIDVEGRELSALRGGIQSIRRFKPDLLVEIFEKPSQFHDRTMEPRDAILKLMTELGYDIHVIGDDGRLLTLAQFDRASSAMSYHNYMFIHPDCEHRRPVGLIDHSWATAGKSSGLGWSHLLPG